MTSRHKPNYLSELRALDWDFEGQTGSEGLAGYHWYPARYVPQVPGLLIGYLSVKGESVLDPFCGSGTTLVEAQRMRRNSFGIDTNPAAVMMARAKLVPFDQRSWAGYASELQKTVADMRSAVTRDDAWLSTVVPNLAEQSTWYDPETLAELACIFSAIQNLAGPYQEVAEATFSSILRFSCSQEKHWGWVCDNVKPVNIVYRPAAKLFAQKLQDYARLRGASEAGDETDGSVTSELVVGDCASVLRELPDEEFDLVVTSPPYYSMTDYIRSQRLTFLWFDWNLYDLKKKESGARYKRHRKSALEQYLDDMTTAFEQIHRVLRPGRSCCVVIGESPSREPYLDDIRDAMSTIGLKIETRIRRRVATQRSFQQLQHEEIILAKKE